MFECHDGLFINDLNRKLTAFHSNNNIISAALYENYLFLMYDIFPPQFVNLLSLTINHCKIRLIHKNTFEKLENLQLLSLEENQISALNPYLLKRNKMLFRLSLCGNRIENISKKMISNLRNLMDLRLSSNRLTQFSNYKSLNLRWLILRNNFIREFHNNTFPNLLKLNLNNNKIKRLTRRMFQQSPNLTQLHITGNLIQSIGRNTFNDLIDLNRILIRNNCLKSISDHDFHNNTNLHHLCFTDNEITTISDNAFQNLQQLYTLCLNKNRISSINSQVLSYSSELITLNLSNNPINDIDPLSFQNLSHLETLIWKKNATTKLIIDKDLFTNNGNLMKIDMSCSNITEIHDAAFMRLDDLYDLNLSSNKIEKLPRPFLPLHNINRVSLQNNRIKRIGDTDFYTGHMIYHLNLSHNHNMAIAAKAFDHDTPINILNLSHVSFLCNRLPKLTSSNHLFELYLHSNQIIEFPYDYFYQLESLHILHVHHNTLKGSRKQNKYIVNYIAIDLNRIKMKILKTPLLLESNKLSTLTLNHCDIEYISADVFVYLKYLVDLNLSYNKLTVIEEHVFDSLVHLDKLYLRGNCIGNFNFNPFVNNSLLTYLNLKQNRLTRLETSHIQRIERLRYLFVDSSCEYSHELIAMKKILVNPSGIEPYC